MTNPDRPRPAGLNRRDLLSLGTGAVLVSVLPLPAFAATEDMRAGQIALFGAREITPGKVTLKLPGIAENGYSVPLDIEVDSPMSEASHVKQIAVFSPRNPVPLIAQFYLGPRTAKAAVSTRIRLGGTQVVQVVAEMSDGSLWSGAATTVVTLAACVVL